MSGDATAYAWECAENMKAWALRAEESNRELRAECGRLLERLDAARQDSEYASRIAAAGMVEEERLRKIIRWLWPARAALGVVGEADDE